jgi:hypothetical protein
MARQTGMSPAGVQRIRAASEIKPQQTQTSKLSCDPNFEAKFREPLAFIPICRPGHPRLCPESFAHLWRHVEGGGRFIVGSFVGYFVEVYGRE